MSEAPESDGTNDDEIPKEIRFHFIKSNSFRVVYADGAYGGLAPGGHIHFALYNERKAIPRLSRRPVTGDKVLGVEEVVESRGDVVREVEVDVVMDVTSVKELRDWLDQKIKDWERVTGMKLPTKTKGTVK